MQNLEIKYVDFTALKGFELDGQRLFELAEQAKYYVASDADSCAVKLRNFAECFVNGIYGKYRIDKRDFDLFAKIKNVQFARKLNTFISAIAQANSTNDTRTQTQENSANVANNASPTNAANSRSQERERDEAWQNSQTISEIQQNSRTNANEFSQNSHINSQNSRKINDLQEISRIIRSENTQNSRPTNETPQSIARKIINILHAVRVTGNKAAHGKSVSPQDAQKALLNIFSLANLITQKSHAIDYAKPNSHINLFDFLELNDRHSFTDEQVEFFKKLAS